MTPAASPSGPPLTNQLAPAGDSTNGTPGNPVVVTVTGGTLQAVNVVAGGKAVAGAMDADSRTWRSTDPLGYGLTYTVTASVNDSTGTAVQKTSSFTTLKPASTASVTFQANALQI